jgi:hypothetical protein
VTRGEGLCVIPQYNRDVKVCTYVVSEVPGERFKKTTNTGAQTKVTESLSARKLR